MKKTLIVKIKKASDYRSTLSYSNDFNSINSFELDLSLSTILNKYNNKDVNLEYGITKNIEDIKEKELSLISGVLTVGKGVSYDSEIDIIKDEKVILEEHEYSRKGNRKTRTPLSFFNLNSYLKEEISSYLVLKISEK